MRQGRGLAAWWGIGVLGAAVWACETARNPGGIQRDLIPPTITLSKVKDTQDISGGLLFTVNASDNLSLKDIRLTYTGGYFAQTDTVFTAQTQSVAISKTITFPKNSGAGGNIQIIGRATDGAGNFAEDTIVIFLVNVQALKVLLIAPATGAVASPGKSIPVQVIAAQASGVRKVGFLVSPASAATNPTTPPFDSIVYTAPFKDSVTFTDTLNVVATTGTFTVTGFAEDSSGRRGTSISVTVTVQSAANDVTPPVVTDSMTKRVEVSDSVTVHASDPSGISWIGFRVQNLAGAVLRFDTVNVSAGNLTDVTRRFSLNLAAQIGSFPTSVIVSGYACDLAAARNCAFSSSSVITPAPPASLTARVAAVSQALTGTGVDTVIIVAGVTRALPAGGTIVDAIFDAHANANTGELYLTNPTLSRVEIFQVANSSFVSAGIPTAGPQPWGIALWPRDTLGNYADTIVVANAGGTELSIVDVTTGVRRLLWRQDLPDFLIETYKVTTSGAGFKTQIVVYNISDRPQYVATVCRPAGGTQCSPDSVFALYSTTPEPSNPSPFTGRATLRMEKLKNTQDTTQLFGHLFWEIGQGFPSSGTDTLRVVMRRGRPYNQTKLILSACAGITIDLSSFGLGDTTFARNSGNFTHGFFGEGGKVTAAFARVMSYTTKAALLHDAATNLACNTAPGGAVRDSGFNDVDLGMSPAVDVNDFISNTATKVASIATNFNGLTNLVRADSIYVLDEGLRLKGTSCTLSTTGTGCVTGAPGMDMNYNHAFAAGQAGTPTFGGSGNPNNRLVFAARPDGNIDVFDTFFYGKVATVPVRDPIIGPLRVAIDASGKQLLFGITARGLVMVRLPAITNPNPAPRRIGSP